MIQSMTAYARIEHKAQWGTASWEIRSVNQRYLEFPPLMIDTDRREGMIYQQSIAILFLTIHLRKR